MVDEYDTEDTDYPVCPWCNHDQMSASHCDEEEYDCEACNKPFMIYQNVTYTTEKISED